MRNGWLLCLWSLLGCNEVSADAPQASLGSVGLDASAIDRSVDPCTDFYTFACGSWMKTVSAPMSRFTEVANRNLEYQRRLLDGARTSSNPIDATLGAFYGSCLNEVEIEKTGTQALGSLISTIGNVQNARSLGTALGALQAAGFDPLFSIAGADDFANPRMVILEIDQAGLGLGFKDSYQSNDLRTRYQKYVESVLRELYPKPTVRARTPEPTTPPTGYRCGSGKPIMGKGCSCGAGMNAARDDEGSAICVAAPVSPAPDFAKIASDVVAFEMELAKLSLDRATRSDPTKMTNRKDPAALAKLAPHIEWNALWSSLSIRPRAINVTSPSYVFGVDGLIAKSNPATLRGYLVVVLAVQGASSLPRRFTEQLVNRPPSKPRWETCISETRTALPDLLGQAFVRDRFSGNAQSRLTLDVGAISTAMAGTIERATWMSSTARAVALKKLARVRYQVGHPKIWKTPKFVPSAKTWSANTLAARRVNRLADVARVDKPANDDDWYLAADAVNMYFDPSQNKLVTLAGLLQPPFFSNTASTPVRLGGIGVFVGHELTHGFDENGGQFDEDGRLASWWDASTRKNFEARERCFVEQYGNYAVLGQNVNGNLTLGENIADTAGVKLAFSAYRTLRTGPPVTAGGYTEDQQFFLAFGQSMCRKLPDAEEKRRLAADPHAPPRWRVNGPLSTMPEFAKAWNCKAGAPMVAAKACDVW